MIVVSDSGPLISLMKAAKLDLLRELYGEVRIPEAVYAELTGNAKYAEEAELVRSSSYVQVVAVGERKAVDILRRASGLDLGESEAIVYADDIKADILLMEEDAGRRIARAMGLRVRGSLGILLLGYDKGILSAQEVDDALDRMKAANRRISEELYQYARDYVRR
jgi:predicted nucleic acid-binding protein